MQEKRKCISFSRFTRQHDSKIISLLLNIVTYLTILKKSQKNNFLSSSIHYTSCKAKSSQCLSFHRFLALVYWNIVESNGYNQA